MKKEKSYFADSSFLIDLVQENKNAVKIAKNSELIVTSILCVYELSKLIDFDKKKLEQNKIVKPTIEEVQKAGEIYRDLKQRGEMVNQIDILISSQSINRNLELLTADKDFKKIKGLETLYYRD
ncbi:MAG: type II toxin-antitoxin system VapC family toxin [Candidatus Nanohaloarchaea archaeon]